LTGQVDKAGGAPGLRGRWGPPRGLRLSRLRLARLGAVPVSLVRGVAGVGGSRRRRSGGGRSLRRPRPLCRPYARTVASGSTAAGTGQRSPTFRTALAPAVAVALLAAACGGEGDAPESVDAAPEQALAQDATPDQAEEDASAAGSPAPTTVPDV